MVIGSVDGSCRGQDLVEQTEAHIVILLLLALLLLHLLVGGLLSTTGSGGHWGSNGSSELAGVLDELLDGLSLLEFHIGGGGQSQQIAESIGHAVRHGSDRRVTDRQTDGGQIGNSGLELGAQILGLDVENFGREDGARVVDLLDLESVRERRDVQHVEEGGLGGSDLVAGLQDGNVVDDFDCSLRDLGRNGQGLEEGGLLGSETGVLGWNGDQHGGNGTGTGRSADLRLGQLLADLGQIALGEDESNVALDVGQQLLQLGVVLQMPTDRLTHHRILSHQNDAGSAEQTTDGLHLLGSDIVGLDDEALWVLIEELLQTKKDTKLDYKSHHFRQEDSSDSKGNPIRRSLSARI